MSPYLFVALFLVSIVAVMCSNYIGFRKGREDYLGSSLELKAMLQRQEIWLVVVREQGSCDVGAVSIVSGRIPTMEDVGKAVYNYLPSTLSNFPYPETCDEVREGIHDAVSGVEVISPEWFHVKKHGLEIRFHRVTEVLL